MTAWFLSAAIAVALAAPIAAAPTLLLAQGSRPMPPVTRVQVQGATPFDTTSSAPVWKDTTLAPPTLTEALLKQVAPAYIVVDSLMQLKGLDAPGMSQKPEQVQALARDIAESDELAAAVRKAGLTPLLYVRTISTLYASWAIISLETRLSGLGGALSMFGRSSPYATEENKAFVKANGKLLQQLKFAPPATGLESIQLMR